jgi:hypothetical protein
MAVDRITLTLTATELAQIECMLVEAARLFEQQAARNRDCHLPTLAQFSQDDADKARRLKSALVSAYISQGAL